ncbi:5-formyltetrahydrofolate cyclo-ligase [Sulfuriferula sp. AH1]|nr:5-formyltetrahydrofolate cyclo-ligase [Sulfuriferula sp. AH1]
MDKTQLRSQLQRRRRALSASQRTQAARQIVRHALRAGLLRRYQHVGAYLPHGAEINTLPLLNRVLSLGKQTYLPMLPFGRGKKLWFNRLEAGNRWTYNRFGIAENHGRKTVRAQHLDLVFMPLVGYDDFGYRIGMGGGYYDASLAFLLQRQRWRRPYLVGVAFACQHVAGKLPHDPWDIPLNAILTEQGLHRFGRF